MLYADLTPAQREQVENLFHDPAFGKDPAWFEYRVSGGQVVGQRVRLEQYRGESTKRGKLTVRIDQVISSAAVSEESLMRRELAYQIISKHLFKILKEKQPWQVQRLSNPALV